MAREDPYSGFRFLVAIDQIRQGGFTKIRGLQRETKVETYHEGGVNEFEHKFITMATYPNLVLERGLADPDLWEWHQQVVEGIVKRRTITVTLRDEQDGDAWSWTAEAAYPVKWASADFDASSGQVAAETIEFVHRGLLRRLGRGRAG
jgi:phage tail-like protein